MKPTSRSVSDLLAAFRSPEPTPGGGSAAALAGAMGASLLAMVAGLPKPKAESEDDVRALADAGRRCTSLALELETLIDRDSESYEHVVQAFRLPKSTDDEKAARTAGIQDALKGATEAPLDVMRRCAAALEVAPIVVRLGNPNASSDAEVGIGLLRAGLAGANQNVEINLGSLKDADYVADVRAEVGRLTATA